MYVFCFPFSVCLYSFLFLAIHIFVYFLFSLLPAFLSLCHCFQPHFHSVMFYSSLSPSFYSCSHIPTSPHVFNISSIPRVHVISEAKERSFMDREGVGAGWFPLCAYCCVPLQGRLAIVYQPKAHVVSKVPLLVIATYIRVNIMQRRLDWTGIRYREVTTPGANSRNGNTSIVCA